MVCRNGDRSKEQAGRTEVQGNERELGAVLLEVQGQEGKLELRKI